MLALKLADPWSALRIYGRMYDPRISRKAEDPNYRRPIRCATSMQTNSALLGRLGRERAHIGWVLIGWAGLGLTICGLGLLAAKGLGLILIVAILLCGALVWIAPRPVAFAAILVGVCALPSSGMSSTKVHGIPIVTSLGLATFCATVALWWYQRGRLNQRLNRYAAAALLLLVIAGIAQLSFARWAATQSVYQLFLLWASGLLLGTMLASDKRMVNSVALLAVPLALLAIIETVLRQPNLWSDLVGASHFDYIAHPGGHIRTSSTFGQPVVAGTALVTMAFIVLCGTARYRALWFAVIVAGALTTVSRSAILGLAVGLFVYFLASRRKRLQVVGAIAMTLAVGWLMISQVPSLKTSFEARVLTQNVQGQEKRLNSLGIIRTAFTDNNQELNIGRGLGGSRRYLEQTGENLGLNTYDNQYMTSSYDSGMFIVLIAVGLIIAAVFRARPDTRRLAPLVISATTFFFFDGLYWNSTGLLFWLTVGLATAPVGMQHARRIPRAMPGKPVGRSRAPHLPTARVAS